MIKEYSNFRKHGLRWLADCRIILLDSSDMRATRTLTTTILAPTDPRFSDLVRLLDEGQHVDTYDLTA